MLFLDDLQWSLDEASFSLVESILSDTEGSCVFFVGSYRSNEVQRDHAIFGFVESLSLAGIPCTSLKLEGLGPEDINLLISDAACLFPRVCRPLSSIVHNKTKVCASTPVMPVLFFSPLLF